MRISVINICVCKIGSIDPVEVRRRKIGKYSEGETDASRRSASKKRKRMPETDKLQALKDRDGILLRGNGSKYVGTRPLMTFH